MEYRGPGGPEESTLSRRASSLFVTGKIKIWLCPAFPLSLSLSLFLPFAALFALAGFAPSRSRTFLASPFSIQPNKAG